MGYFTNDAATLARINHGLSPDEHVHVFYVMDENQARSEADRQARCKFIVGRREDNAWRARNGWPQLS